VVYAQLARAGHAPEDRRQAIKWLEKSLAAWRVVQSDPAFGTPQKRQVEQAEEGLGGPRDNRLEARREAKKGPRLQIWMTSRP